MSVLRPLLILAVLALGLVWFDVLPGSWRLRTWVVPQAVRSSQVRLEHRQARLARFGPMNRKAEAGSLVFLGSSTLERFDLAAHFPGQPCENRGIGDEDLAQLMERLDASLPPVELGGVVLYAGSIDFRRYGQPGSLLAARVGVLLDRLRRRAPDAPIVLLGLLPEVDFPASEVARLGTVNAALARACAEKGATFVSTARPPVVGPDGTLNPAFAADRLHLNGAGYLHLAQWLRDAAGPLSGLLRKEFPAPSLDPAGADGR